MRSTGEGADGPVTRRSRAVVLAVAAGAAGGIVRTLAPDASRALSSIEYAPVAVAASAYRRADIAHSLAGFGFLVPKKEQRQVLGSLFSCSMFDGRAPEGAVLLTTFIGGRRNPDLPGRPDADLARLVHDELVGARRRARRAAVDRGHALAAGDPAVRPRAPRSAWRRSRRPKPRCRGCTSARASAAASRSATASRRGTRSRSRSRTASAGTARAERTRNPAYSAAPQFQQSSNVAGFSSRHAPQKTTPSRLRATR